MKTRNLLFGLLCLGFFAIACTKTDSNSSGSTTSGTTTSSTTSGTTSSGAGTCYLTRQDQDSLYSVVDYDASNNPTLVTTKNTSNNKQVSASQIEYSSPGVISKITMLDPDNNLTEYRQLSYSSDGTVSASDFYGSTGGSSLKNTFRIEFTYNSAKQIVQEDFYDMRTTKTLISTYKLSYDADGDCNKTVGYYTGSTTPAYTSTYTFDTKKSPQTLKFTQYVNVGNTTNPHNATSLRIDYAGGTSVTSLYTYEYNSNGYPTKATLVSGSSTMVYRNTYNCK